MINWKLRLQNKATLTSLGTMGVTIVYTTLGIFGVVPAVSQEQVVNLLLLLIEFLLTLGIIVDPTTEGIGDSKRALSYDCPHCDERDGE